MDDGSSYTNWDVNQPGGGESTNCMYMYYDNGTWYDYPCDYTAWYAVCSKPIASAGADANITRA